MSTPVRVEKNGPITTIILARAQLKNAIDRPTADALAGAFRDFEADKNAKVAVLFGEGGTFCAGADLKAIARGEPNKITPDGDGPLGPTRMVLQKPSIAAISGHAVAGGLELALFCDLRVAEEDAILGVFCRRWGVPLIDGGTVRLPRVVGLGRALDLILTGRAVSANEALSMGLVNRVVPSGEGRTAAEELGRLIAGHPEVCMRQDRLSAYESLDRPFVEAMENEFRRGMTSLSEGVADGATRFTERAR